jgi:hypothetical protein
MKTETIGIANGARFDVTPYKTNGFQLTITSEKTGKVLFDEQMILYTLCDAIYTAAGRIWADEIEKKNLWELPSIVLMELGVEFCEDD